MVAGWEANSPSGRSIPRAYWPDSIRGLNPVDIYPHMFGVLVVTSADDRYHQGIYIVTADDPEEESTPSSGSGVNYSPIALGLHHAEVKIRRGVRRDG